MTYDVHVHTVKRVEADSAEDAALSVRSAVKVMEALGHELRSVEPAAVKE